MYTLYINVSHYKGYLMLFCYVRLSNKMSFLFVSFKTYPPRQEGESLVSTAEDAYTHAKDFLEGIQLNQEKSSSTSKYRDHREKNLKHVVSSMALNPLLFFKQTH